MGKNQLIASVVVLSITLVFHFSGQYSLAVLCLSGWAFWRFLASVGEKIPLLELMQLLAVMQWVLGPLIAYNYTASFEKYIMAVPPEVYFQVVIPATWFFILGLNGLYLFKISDSFNFLKKDYSRKLALIFILTGLLSTAGAAYIPPSLRFLSFLLSSLLYVGVLLYYGNTANKFRVPVLLSGLASLFLLTSASGIFHTFILWGVIFFCFYSQVVKIRPVTKFAAVIVGFLFLMTLQLIKSDFREGVAAGKSPVNLFASLILTQVTSNESYFSPGRVADLNVRLNQGWIISNIIKTVPRRVEFVDGETVKEAVIAAIVPRFIYADKAKAGGQENFVRFTGLRLNRSTTSMGISIVGEAYVNYGSKAWLFMLFWGLLINFTYRLLIQKSIDVPLLYFLIPVVFLQVLKAETELVVVLNHLVKSLMLITLLWPLIKKLSAKHQVAAPQTFPA